MGKPSNALAGSFAKLTTTAPAPLNTGKIFQDTQSVAPSPTAIQPSVTKVVSVIGGGGGGGGGGGSSTVSTGNVAIDNAIAQEQQKVASGEIKSFSGLGVNIVRDASGKVLTTSQFQDILKGEAQKVASGEIKSFTGYGQNINSTNVSNYLPQQTQTVAINNLISGDYGSLSGMETQGTKKIYTQDTIERRQTGFMYDSSGRKVPTSQIVYIQVNPDGSTTERLANKDERNYFLTASGGKDYIITKESPTLRIAKAVGSGVQYQTFKGFAEGVGQEIRNVEREAIGLGYAGVSTALTFDIKSQEKGYDKFIQQYQQGQEFAEAFPLQIQDITLSAARGAVKFSPLYSIPEVTTGLLKGQSIQQISQEQLLDPDRQMAAITAGVIAANFIPVVGEAVDIYFAKEGLKSIGTGYADIQAGNVGKGYGEIGMGLTMVSPLGKDVREAIPRFKELQKNFYKYDKSLSIFTGEGVPFRRRTAEL